MAVVTEEYHLRRVVKLLGRLSFRLTDSIRYGGGQQESKASVGVSIRWETEKQLDENNERRKKLKSVRRRSGGGLREKCRERLSGRYWGQGCLLITLPPKCVQRNEEARISFRWVDGLASFHRGGPGRSTLYLSVVP